MCVCVSQQERYWQTHLHIMLFVHTHTFLHTLTHSNTHTLPPPHRELVDLGTAFAHMGEGLESLLTTTAECGARPPTAMGIVSGTQCVYVECVVSSV